MATLDPGMMEGCEKLRRMAVHKLDAMKVCGSCEFGYHSKDGDIKCAKDRYVAFRRVCDEYVFINDWTVRK